MVVAIKIVARFAYKVAEPETFIGKTIEKRWFTQDLQGKTEGFYL